LARILVVDDEAPIRYLIVMALRNAKHAVMEADNGQEALDTLGREMFDLVISDIQMPKLDGVGLVQAIRCKYPSLPLVIMSGGDRNSLADRFSAVQKLGVQMVLSKPFTGKQLLAAVDAVLGR
jgi:CheY-like chemotaxis protein